MTFQSDCVRYLLVPTPQEFRRHQAIDEAIRLQTCQAGRKFLAFGLSKALANGPSATCDWVSEWFWELPRILEEFHRIAASHERDG